MASESKPRSFHFVSVSNPSTSSISRQGRSFVTGNIRAGSSWSTKSAKPQDKRKSKRIARSTAVVLPKGRVLRSQAKDQNGPPQSFKVGERQAPEVLLDFWVTKSLRTISPRPPGVSIPGVNDEDIHTLLTYFDSILCPVAAANISKIAHEQLKNDWIRPSLNHAASTHAILAFTALRLSMARPDVPYYIRFAERQRLLAIMAMRRSLEHSDEATCNENITAVYNLICFEETLFLPSPSHSQNKALQPDYTQLKAHINGLRQMVALRGGLQVPVNDQGQNAEPILTEQVHLPHQALITSLIFQPHSDSASSGSIGLQTKLSLPRGLMKQIYSYPESSFFFTESTLKASSWCKAGIHHGLHEFLITADCLLKDTSAWLRQPDSYKWDLLGVQSLYGLAIEMFPRWRYEASSGATNADQLVALFTAVLIFFISNNGQLLDHIPMHSSEIQALVSDPKVWPIMRAAGLDLWLAFLLVLSSSHQAAYRDYFFRMHVSILEAHKPKIHSVKEYVQNLHDTLWLPQRLDKYARQLWYRTEGEAEQQW